MGRFTVNNKGSVDSVVSLVPESGNKPAMTFYVRGKAKATAYRIRDGKYKVYITSGTDWDSKAKAFTRNCQFSVLDGTEKYSTTSRTYTAYTLTLAVASGGNTSSNEVDPDRFPS